MKHFWIVFLIAITGIGNPAVAADIVTDVRAESTGPDIRDGGFFEFGVSLNQFTDGEGLSARFAPVIGFAYRKRGFFAESHLSSTDATHLGYNLWNNNRWSFDLIGLSGSVSRRGRSREVEDDSSDVRGDKAILNRPTLYSGTGIRLTGYFGNAVFQFRLVDDLINHNGVTSTARIGYNRQLKNWNVHGILSASYASKEANDFWYGVDDDKATERFTPYKPDSSFEFSAELGASYPINEHVVFRSILQYKPFSNEIVNSPLVDSDFAVRSITSLNYVF